MYKVLLVDDEPTIREGLRTLIPWNELGFEVADTAANGQEALQKCEQIRPDLLIADIRMPGMTGLELIKSVRSSELDMHVLILSGYADFEYAKQAIAQRIDGYLLKPVDEDELTGYLVRLKEELDSVSTSGRNRTEEREIKLETAIQSLLAGESDLVSATAGISERLDWDSYEVILIKPITSNEIVPSLLALIKNKLRILFNERERGVVFTMEPYLGIVLNGGIGDDRSRKSIHKEIWDACSGHVIDVFAVSGGEVHGWPEIVESYQMALVRMKDRFFLENGTISLAYRDKEYSLQPESVEHVKQLDRLFLAAVDTLYLALEIGNHLAARQLIQETAEEMAGSGSTEDEIKTRFVQLFSTVLDKLTHNRSEMHSLEIRAGLVEIYKETRYLGLIERLSAIAEGMSSSMDNAGTDTVIKRMIDLIHRNYRENLKLEKLSELFNYNSAYLGKLFKQATGEHFNTYLDKVRIEQAKLLIEQGLKVYQVAEKVGYANVDYFHTKFRKYVGTSPSNYKKKE
ncbi:response regulator transcription factor [Cohnella luojiensis]|nr:response regulator transcription factor [Cohnella luojiensis]